MTDQQVEVKSGCSGKSIYSLDATVAFTKLNIGDTVLSQLAFLKKRSLQAAEVTLVTVSNPLSLKTLQFFQRGSEHHSKLPVAELANRR
jgi:hypothetical protein